MKSGIFKRQHQFDDHVGYAEVEEADLGWHVQQVTEHLHAELEAIVSASRAAEHVCRSLDRDTSAEVIRQSSDLIGKALRSISAAVNEAIGRADQLALCSTLELAFELEGQLRGYRITASHAEGVGAS